MNRFVCSISVIVALAASFSVIASEPEREVVAAPAAAAPAAPAVAAAEAARPVEAAAAVVPAAAAKPAEPKKVPAGYKVKVVDGETRFCRKDTPLGSRFPTEVCMTQAQYEDQERNRDSMRNELQDRQKSYSINN